MSQWTYVHQKRKALNKRILAEIERNKAERFLDRLKRNEITYTQWLNEQIDNELKGIELK